MLGSGWQKGGSLVSNDNLSTTYCQWLEPTTKSYFLCKIQNLQWLSSDLYQTDWKDRKYNSERNVMYTHNKPYTGICHLDDMAEKVLGYND